ncbi:MAG TPA: hypothetical protein VJP89_02610 [Pyrinomonadaceae bacterium]|nr:hypothetical protein [Pyrinomonadaceae bacterium]
MANTDPDKSSSAAFLEKVDSTVVVWLVFLIFGGGIISLYYARIHYLPDIEWSSSIVHMAVATFVGGAITLVLALSLLIPGYIWSEFLIFDERIKKAFCFHPTSNDLCLRTLWKYVGLPFWLVLLGNHLALLLLQCVLPKNWLQGQGLIVVYILISVGLLFIVGCNRKPRFIELVEKAKESEPQESSVSAEQDQPQIKQSGEEENSRRVFKYVAWFVLSVGLGQTSMLLFFLLLGRRTDRNFIAITVLCAIAVLVSNHFVALHYHRSHSQAISAALVIALLLLVVADRNESLSTQILSAYGIGVQSQTVDLLLNDEGQRIIDRLKLPCTCKGSPPKRICQIHVLSRLGNEYYLDYKGQRFTLPKTAVVSRSPAQP